MSSSPFCATPEILRALLGREEIAVDMAAIGTWLRGKRILLTGAGGTLGSALAGQLADLAPAQLILLDHTEYGLWRLTRTLTRISPSLSVQAVLADIRDARRMHAVCAAARPEVVLHVAALKHLPMVEANPLEGLLTNAIGTRIVARAARESGAHALLLVSTDKAVDPASVMGASKRIAELYCLAEDRAAASSSSGMRHFIIRFGNVLASSGSVLEHWHAELATGAPLSLTDPAMTRYLTTPAEAARLILLVLACGLAGTIPAGGLCLPDMGQPVAMRELVDRLARAVGLAPGRDIPLRITGQRPGEKLTESLLHAHEHAQPIPGTGLLVSLGPGPEAPLLARALDELTALCSAGEERLALLLVSRLIPGFRHRTACREGRLRA